MEWHEYFEYEQVTGQLIWKRRPVSHFLTTADAARWNATHPGKIAGTPWLLNDGSANGIRILIGSRQHRAHHIVWNMLHGAIPVGMLIDHKDGNPLNNRAFNLRLATKAENNRNVGRRKDNTSGYKGVSFAKREKKWTSSIRVNGKSIWLGSFPAPEAAYAAYCEAAHKYHGEFAHHTLIPPTP